MAKAGQNEQNGLEQLKKDLKAGQFGRLYVFYGEEHYLRDHYLKQLQKKLLDDVTADFNYHRFQPENMDWDLFAEAVEAMPMMAEHTMVQVEDLEINKLNEANRERLTAILSDIPEYCTVILVSGASEWKADGRYKALKAALDQGLQVDFKRQNQRELNSWIRRHFMALGKDISDELCEYLTFLTGGSMTTLEGEISKLAAYASGTQVTKQDMDTVVTPVLDAQVFDLTDAISAGDYDAALQKLRTLLQLQEEPIFLLAAIGSQLRRLLYARSCLADGSGETGLAELMKSAGGRAPHPYVLQKTMSAARRVSDEFCRQAVCLCYETDIQLKSYSGDDQRTMELLLTRLAKEARRG